jgi:hypothetical protein
LNYESEEEKDREETYSTTGEGPGFDTIRAREKIIDS